MFIQAFFEGIIAGLGALVLELATQAGFNLPPVENALFTLLIFVAIEEILKYALIYNHYLKSVAKQKIVPSALLIGLGFALTELFLKQLAYQKEDLLPVLGLVSIHLLTAAIAGYFLRQNYGRHKFFIGLLLALNIILHFGYNLLILDYF
jgi:RsiW-degrading membrane proteinase PrsW (M82 family)